MNFLHLEDSAEDAILIQDFLATAWPECRVQRAGNRAEYLHALEQGDFDVILSDYSMPGFDGLSALDLAKARHPNKPFIFLSGTIGEERAIEALQRGATDYIIKDRPSRLIPSIRQALERVTEAELRRRSEEALRDSQERFRQLAEQSSDGFWFAALEPERLLYVSPAMERIWGLPASSFYQKPRAWTGSIHPEDRARVETAYDSWVRGRAATFEEEYRVVRPDGWESWVLQSGTLIRDTAGKVVRLCGTAKDITGRHIAEDRLRDQASLLDKARDAIIATDLSHRVAYWNASAERLYGWPAADAFGRRLDDLELGYAPGDLARARDALLASGEWRGNFSLRTRTGATLQVESTWSLVLDARGHPRSILLIDTDVTDRKKLETQLLRADRMDSIGMLAGGVAHDLNNVLTPILMGTELLRFCLTDPTNLRILDNMESSAKHGSALVRQLLTFARGGEAERTEVKIGPLVEDVRNLLRQSLPANIELIASCPESIASIRADATQIKQVLINLCLNARDAMPSGGGIAIGVENTLVDESLARLHPGTSPGPHLAVSVRDTGTGIPPEFLNKIFDPFFTTKGVAKGTGLGLSTVAGIVKSHGGFLTVESQIGKGTVFNLVIPVQARATPAVARTSSPFKQTGTGETILVIDDDPSVCDTFRVLLEQAGYRVRAASDAVEGLEDVERSGDVAAVLVDLMLPGAPGENVIAALRARRPNQPIVALSAVGRPAAIEALRSLNPPIEFLAKPVAAESLLLALRQAIGRKKA